MPEVGLELIALAGLGLLCAGLWVKLTRNGKALADARREASDWAGKAEAAARNTGAAEQRARLAETALESLPLDFLVYGDDLDDPEPSESLAVLLDLDPAAPCTQEDLVAAFVPEAKAEMESFLQALADPDKQQTAQNNLELLTRSDRRRLEVIGVRVGDLEVLSFRDISAVAAERARTAEATARLEAFFDRLPVPLWRRDSAGRLSDCNAAFARAVDQDRETVLERQTELPDQAQRAAVKDLTRRVLAEREPASERFHLVAEGTRRLMEITELPADDGGVIGIAVDVTRCEELEGELRRHVEAHAGVLETLNTGVAIFGPNQELEFYNGEYARLWGLPESYLDGRPSLDEVLERLREDRKLPEQPDFPAYKREWIQRITSQAEAQEELLHLPDGHTLRLVSNPHPFGGVLLLYEDVTDRMSLERSYNTLIEVQRETLDNLYEGVAVFGADGRLKLHNPAYGRIWHLPPERLAKEPHVRDLMEATRRFFPIEARDWTEALEQRVAGTTDPAARSGRRERSDGTVIDWAQVPLPDGASLFTFVDVTDSTRVERALRERNEALVTADRLKSEFLANISYELRTPLNAIIGFAEILQNQYFGPLNERQAEYSRAIVKSSEQLTALINDVLDLASIEAGYMELDRAPAEIRPLLESVYTLVHERAQSRNIRLLLDCPADSGSLEIDARRIKQAVFNLLSNALKYTQKGGIVRLAAKRGHTEMQISVTDTGVGIAAEDVDRVFEKFEKGKQGGVGLGLSLVKSLIELHGGWVELHSAPNKGTQVICHLPLAPSAAGRETTDQDVAVPQDAGPEEPGPKDASPETAGPQGPDSDRNRGGAADGKPSPSEPQS
jgi:PAS domain S-box-containing protein